MTFRTAPLIRLFTTPSREYVHELLKCCFIAAFPPSIDIHPWVYGVEVFDIIRIVACLRHFNGPGAGWGSPCWWRPLRHSPGITLVPARLSIQLNSIPAISELSHCRRGRAAEAGPQRQGRRGRAAEAGPQRQGRRGRAAEAGPQRQGRRGRAAEAGPQRQGRRGRAAVTSTQATLPWDLLEYQC